MIDKQDKAARVRILTGICAPAIALDQSTEKLGKSGTRRS
jgi:hypothetical protein